MWLRLPSDPCAAPFENDVCGDPSPQSTSTSHGLSFTPGSLKVPRPKLWLEPSSELWSTAAVTLGVTLCTVTWKPAEPVAPSLSVTLTETE